MSKRGWKMAAASAALSLAAAAAVFEGGRSPSVGAEAKAEVQPKAVDPSMHEFMEYLFEPPYKRVKAALAEEPKDNAVWKSLKSDAMILAEGGNLLLLRTPKEDAAAWNELSAAVRDSGAGLYQAARKKDFQAARQQYEALLLKCNACHDKFAGGEHQLKP